MPRLLENEDVTGSSPVSQPNQNKTIMKQLSYILQCAGILVLVIFVMRMFGLLEKYITTDKQWFALLFIGQLLSVGGFLLEAIIRQPITQHQVRSRKNQIRYLSYATFCLAALTILLYFA